MMILCTKGDGWEGGVSVGESMGNRRGMGEERVKG